METWIASIANIGFPIVVSIYLLTRVEGRMEALTESIQELAHAIKRSE